MNELTEWTDGQQQACRTPLECCGAMTWYDIRSSNIDENAASMPPPSQALPCLTPSVLKSPGFLSPDIGWLHRMNDYIGWFPPPVILRPGVKGIVHVSISWVWPMVTVSFSAHSLIRSIVLFLQGCPGFRVYHSFLLVWLEGQCPHQYWTKGGGSKRFQLQFSPLLHPFEP